MSTTALHASDCRCWLCIDRENRRTAVAQIAAPSDRAEVWAQIEATLQGVIDDGTNAEIDELDAELLLGLVRSRGAPAPTGQQAEPNCPMRVIEAIAEYGDARANKLTPEVCATRFATVVTLVRSVLAGLATTPPVGQQAEPIREFLGKMVRTEWMKWAREQPEPKASWLQSWEQLTEPEREVDRRIGEAIWRFSYCRDTGQQAERPAPAGQALWQPIVTAPRDGRSIIVRFGQDGVSQAKYIAGVPHPWQFIDTNDGITWLINHAIDGLGGPSHWQPMPPQP